MRTWAWARLCVSVCPGQTGDLSGVYPTCTPAPPPATGDFKRYSRDFCVKCPFLWINPQITQHRRANRLQTLPAPHVTFTHLTRLFISRLPVPRCALLTRRGIRSHVRWFTDGFAPKGNLSLVFCQCFAIFSRLYAVFGDQTADPLISH